MQLPYSISSSTTPRKTKPRPLSTKNINPAVPNYKKKNKKKSQRNSSVQQIWLRFFGNTLCFGESLIN
jgi:hypothetical protein